MKRVMSYFVSAACLASVVCISSAHAARTNVVEYVEHANSIAENITNSVPTKATVTNLVRSCVSVASRYMWDEGGQCLYRWDMDYGFTYLTPVTNVNALLPENAHILKYIEEHKEEEQ